MEAKMDHIAVRVNNIEVAHEWFKKYFGFDEILPPGKVPMKASGSKGMRCCIGDSNGAILELEEHEESKVNKGDILTHIGFKVDDVEEYYKSLLEGGALQNSEEVKDMGPVKILYFTGIDGMEIELVEVK